MRTGTVLRLPGHQPRRVGGLERVLIAVEMTQQPRIVA
jgi:hypothetical protein